MTSIANTNSGRRLAFLTLLISVPFALFTLSFLVVVAGGDMSMFYDPAALLAVTPDKARLLYLGYWSDIFGYYLILVPAMLFLWRWLRPLDPGTADVAGVFGVVYALLGGIGAAHMAAAYQAIFAANLGASGAEAAALNAAWLATVTGGWQGLWVLAPAAGAVWAFGTGRLLLAHGRRYLGWLTTVIALAWAVHFVLKIAGLSEVSDLFSTIVIILQPIWAMSVAIALRKPIQPVLNVE